MLLMRQSMSGSERMQNDVTTVVRPRGLRYSKTLML